jgi:hypothetical protein
VKHTVLAAWFGATVLLGACTGNPVVPTNLETYRFSVSSGGWWMQDVIVRGTDLQVWLTWQNEGTNLDLYWTNARCTIDQDTGTFTGAGCEVMAKSTSAGGTSETMDSSEMFSPFVSSRGRVRLFVQHVTGPSERAALTVVSRYR